MTQLQQFELLLQCYQSDLNRLEAIKEAAWYFAQLPGQDDFDVQAPAFLEACDQEAVRIRVNMRDLRSLMEEMKMYQVRCNGSTTLESTSLGSLLQEAATQFQHLPPKQKPPAQIELWQDGRYVANLVWNGTSLEVHWCGD